MRSSAAQMLMILRGDDTRVYARRVMRAYAGKITRRCCSACGKNESFMRVVTPRRRRKQCCSWCRDDDVIEEVRDALMLCVERHCLRHDVTTVDAAFHVLLRLIDFFIADSLLTPHAVIARLMLPSSAFFIFGYRYFTLDFTIPLIDPSPRRSLPIAASAMRQLARDVAATSECALRLCHAPAR